MKKEKKPNRDLPERGLKPEGISKRGIKVILAGVALLAIGFFVLTKTDPAGQNLASNISPFLILGGYITIGIGILTPEKEPAGQAKNKT